MNFKSITFVLLFLLVLKHGEPALLVKQVNVENDEVVKAPRIQPIILKSNMKLNLQQEIRNELINIYDQVVDQIRCEQWALTVSEKQRTKYACFRYDGDLDNQGGGAYYIDPSAQFIKLQIQADPPSPYANTNYLLFNTKK